MSQEALITERVAVVFAILTAELHHEAEAEEEGVSVSCFDSCSETVRVSSRDVTRSRPRLDGGGEGGEGGSVRYFLNLQFSR